MKKLTSALIVMALLVSGAALASAAAPKAAHNGTQPVKQHKEKRSKFDECDKDKDGGLTLEEALACYPRIKPKFDAIDADKDGKITKEEIKAYRAAHKKSKPKAPAAQ